MTSTTAQTRSRRRAALAAAGRLAAALAAGALAAGCGAAGDDATSGKRLTLATQIAPDAASAAPFTNALGWTITLSKAHLAIGSLHYFEGAPFTARRPSPGGAPRCSSGSPGGPCPRRTRTRATTRPARRGAR